MGPEGLAVRRGKQTARALAALLACWLLALAGCGDGGSDRDGAADAATTTVAADGTGSSTTAGPTSATSGGTTEATGDVRRLTLELVDTSRPTAAGRSTPPADTRMLVTEVYVPPGDGPFPLVVFGHGLSGHPDDFTRLLGAWAEAGYLVAAPAFPLTNLEVSDSGANFGDVANQPADVSFVIDEVLRLADEPQSDLTDLVDGERIGVAGLSLGGITTYAATFSDCCRDDRVDAAVVLAGAAEPADNLGSFAGPADVPVLVMHGDADTVIPFDAAVVSYDLLDGPRYLVTLLGGGHAEPFSDRSTDFAPIVDEVTVDFWDAYLARDADAVDRLIGHAQVDGLTTLERAG